MPGAAGNLAGWEPGESANDKLARSPMVCEKTHRLATERNIENIALSRVTEGFHQMAPGNRRAPEERGGSIEPRP